jgi:DNA-binding CsgD family transcriptional regulator
MYSLEILTKREIQILKLVCSGYSNNEISQKLFISEHTVKYHVVSVLKKFNVKNRVYLAYIVGKNNLI